MHIFYLGNYEFFESFWNDSFKSLPLIDLYLKNSTKLKELTTNLCSMTFLVAIHFKSCFISEVLSKKWTCLNALKEIKIIKYTCLKIIWNGIRSFTYLKIIHMYECKFLEEFPSRLLNLVILEIFNISKCTKLKKFSKGFESLTCLKTLYM